MMLVVDPQKRASLQEVELHPWLAEGGGSGVDPPTPPVALSSMDELPPEEVDSILRRMESGGYGTKDEILK